MVGEQLRVSLITAAADAITKAEIALKAEYLEGGGHSELPILVANGDGATPPLQVRLICMEFKKDLSDDFYGLLYSEYHYIRTKCNVASTYSYLHKSIPDTYFQYFQPYGICIVSGQNLHVLSFQYASFVL